MNQILIVEDDISLNRGLCRALASEGYRTVPCKDLKMAREQILMDQPSLVILDVNLPDGSGLDFLRECKSGMTQVPVILLTANDTDLDVVQGLDMGADDYITKPFSLSVLRARVRTQLRKSGKREMRKNGSVFSQGRYRFDFENMVFLADGAKVDLSRTEQKLLKILTDNCGTAVSRDRLIDRIWTDGAAYVDENALSVSVKRLRDKLGADWDIRTVYGIGYLWEKNDD